MINRQPAESNENKSKKKKILFAVDLDYTQFNTAKSGPVSDAWIGGKGFWLDLYKELNEMALKKSCQFILSIVTAKDDYDVIANEAVTTLRPYFETSNPKMFKKKEYKPGCDDWCLINKDREYLYTYLHPVYGAYDHSDIPQDGFSNIYVVGTTSKAKAVKEIANKYAIHTDFCMLLDDTDSVLDKVKGSGIEVVSFECFHYEHEKLKDESYVNSHLTRIKQEIMAKFENMLQMPFKEPEPDVVVEQPEKSIQESNINIFKGSFEKSKTKLPDWFLNRQESFISLKRDYYMVGMPVQVKDIISGETSKEAIQENVQACLDKLSEEAILFSFPKNGVIKLFSDLNDARSCSRACLQGNIYDHSVCFQPVVFHVKVMDLSKLSRLQHGVIKMNEKYNGSSMSLESKCFFVETDVSNVNPLRVELKVSLFGQSISHAGIEMQPADKVLGHFKK